MIRVVLVDDQTLVRQGVRGLLELVPDIEVVGEASDGEEALAKVPELRPDVLLLDIRMPRLDGVAVLEALRAGASGFLLKETLPDELIAAVRVVASGQSLLAPSVTRRLVEEFVRRPVLSAEPPPGLDTLTEREAEVLVAVAHGLSNTEIGQRLFMSPATAKTHVSRVLTKLHARDRAQLVMLAYEAGVVEPGAG